MCTVFFMEKIRHPLKIRPSTSLGAKINIRHCLIFRETGYIANEIFTVPIFGLYISLLIDPQVYFPPFKNVLSEVLSSLDSCNMTEAGSPGQGVNMWELGLKI